MLLLSLQKSYYFRFTFDSRLRRSLSDFMQRLIHTFHSGSYWWPNFCPSIYRNGTSWYLCLMFSIYYVIIPFYGRHHYLIGTNSVITTEAHRLIKILNVYRSYNIRTVLEVTEWVYLYDMFKVRPREGSERMLLEQRCSMNAKFLLGFCVLYILDSKSCQKKNYKEYHCCGENSFTYS